MRTYDATFIFLTSMTEDAIEKTLARIGDEVSRFDGTVVSTEAQGRRSFARPMRKQEAGFYYKVVLSLPPESVDPLLGRFKLIDDIFRVQIVLGKAPEAAEEEAPVEEAPAAVPATEAPAPEPAAPTLATKEGAPAAPEAPAPAESAAPVSTPQEESDGQL